MNIELLGIITYNSQILWYAFFKNHFEDFKDNYHSKLKDAYAELRLEHIAKQAEALLVCGDYKKGVALIQCTNMIM